MSISLRLSESRTHVKTISRLLFVFVFLLPLLFGCSSTKQLGRHDSFADAAERAQMVVDAVNANAPENLYPLLSQSLRSMISEQDFIKNFADERSYPYLTPLFLNLNGIELSSDGTAKVVCSVASRLPGEFYTFSLSYEGDAYYAYIFEDVVNGTYKEKFNHIVTW